jgi:glycosyltransferase involved in cell wall biosynthesis
MKKILALAPYPYLSADTRYRICQFKPGLRNANWDLTLRPFMDDDLFNIYNKRGMFAKKAWRTLGRTISRFNDCLKAGEFDVVILHKEAFPFGPPVFEKILHNNQPKVIYDLDDAFWTHPPQFHQIGNWLRDPKRIQKMIGLSSYVLAGNPFLADFARQFNPHVSVFPTVLDTNKYLPRKEMDDGMVTVGWVGRWSSESYLVKLIPVFKALSKKFSSVRFKFIGTQGIHYEGLQNVDTVPWRLETEVEDIASFNIGIMPLPSDVYSQGKCGFKLLQYMALGIPGVASPIGVNVDIISDGENGFLASSEQEWIEKLSLLIENPRLRKELGSSAREKVVKDYSLEKKVPELLEILEKV